MKLDIKQSYLAMFEQLDGIYEETKDDCLGSLLGGFNPDLFIGSMSADPAAWEDWKKAVEKITGEELLTSDEVLCAVREFIKFHQEEFGFDLNWLIDKLNATSVDSSDWIRSVRTALNQ